MSRRCVVPGCGRYQKRSDDFSFYELPKDEPLRRRWVEVLHIDGETIRAQSTVCGRHFDKEYHRCRRLPVGVVPIAEAKTRGNITHSPPANSKRTVIVLDSPESEAYAKRTKITPAAHSEDEIDCQSALSTYKLSQGSSLSAGSNSDQTYHYQSSPGEEVLEKVFCDGAPKKDYLPMDKSRNFLVSERQLRILLGRCVNCGAKCGEAFAKSLGVDAEFYIECKLCGELTTWTTQPTLPESTLQKGNLDTTAAVILAGSTYEDLSSIANNLNLKIMSPASFYRYANEFIYPAVNAKYCEKQREIIGEIKRRQDEDLESSLNLAIDCRFSRPGYTATFGDTTAMDTESGKIIATVVKSKTDTDVASSAAMETVGTRILLKSLTSPAAGDEGGEEPVAGTSSSPNFDIPGPSSSQGGPFPPLRVGMVVTDENQSVIAMMRTNFPAIKHEADPWHMRKSIIAWFRKAAKKKENAMLALWIPSIRNWLWTSMKQCNGNADLLIDCWRSICYHIIGQHRWEEDDSFKEMKICLHGPLAGKEIAYLSPTSTAYQAVCRIVNDGRIQARLRRCTMFMQTSQLESFHGLLCRFVPKHLAFTAEVFETRVHMAVLDWNENVDRPILTDKTGHEIVSYSYPASAAAWRARWLREDRSTEWSREIMDCLHIIAVDRWKEGHKISDGRRAVLTHLPLVTTYIPPQRELLRERLGAL